MIPWDKDGGQWQIASCDQFPFEKQRKVIEGKLEPVTKVWASRAQIQARQQQLFQVQLAHHSKVCVPREQSCRGLGFSSLHKAVRWAAMMGLAPLVFLLITLNAAHSFFILGVLLMACNLTASTLLKAIARLYALQPEQPPKEHFKGLLDVLPKVSILIPLYREKI